MKAACLNGKKCVCLKGYFGDGKFCKNENECENGKHNCIDPAICKKEIQKISELDIEIYLITLEKYFL